LCEALGVSRGGFYAWLTRLRSQRSRSDEELGAKVRASFVASDRTYGARRVWKDMPWRKGCRAGCIGLSG
jgi:putative transposase